MKYMVIFCLFGALVACQKSADRDLVWHDEFDQDGAPDPSRWDYDLGDGCPDNCGWGNNELQYYTKDVKNVRVENGFLVIEARRDSLGGKGFTSTKILTRGLGDWLYGKLEIRA